MDTKILLIEDEMDLVDNIQTLLESYNYTVLSAKNGVEGIKLAKEYSPDLIICDIMMPGMDGYGVIRELNKDCRTSLIPFIYLTAKVEHKDFRKGMELGADDYLFKPFSSLELLGSIQARLEKFRTMKASLMTEESADKKIKKHKTGDSILFHVNNSPCFIKLERIKFIYAERQYTNVVLKDGKHIIVRKSLNEWEQILPDNLFTRIHRTTIVNIDYIKKIEKFKVNSYKVILIDTSEEFEISRRYSKKIREHFTI